MPLLPGSPIASTQHDVKALGALWEGLLPHSKYALDCLRVKTSSLLDESTKIWELMVAVGLSFVTQQPEPILSLKYLH